MLKRARKLLNDTMDFMMNEVQQTKDNIKETNEKIDEYKEVANNDAKKVEKAKNDSITASVLAAKANSDLTKSLQDVDKLIETIEGLDEINIKELEEAERRFAAAKDTIENVIEAEINFLENKLEEQNKTISEYELDLEPLRREVNFVNELYLYLPKTCFRSKEGLEGAKNNNIINKN